MHEGNTASIGEILDQVETLRGEVGKGHDQTSPQNAASQNTALASDLGIRFLPSAIESRYRRQHASDDE